MSPSPFLRVPPEQWVASNALAFAERASWECDERRTLSVTRAVYATCPTTRGCGSAAETSFASTAPASPRRCAPPDSSARYATFGSSFSAASMSLAGYSKFCSLPAK